MSTQENKKFNIKLSLEELNLVLGSLAEAPAKVSMGLIIEIQKQAQAQDSSEEKTITLKK